MQYGVEVLPGPLSDHDLHVFYFSLSLEPK